MPLKNDLCNRTVVVCSNYAWTVLNFRMPIIRRLKAEGYRVIVLTQFDGFENSIKSEVDEIRPLFISRQGINPLIDFFTFLDFIRHLISLRPSYIFLFTIKPVIYGSLAARIIKIKSIVMITGLGTAFIKDNWITKLVKVLYKFSLSKVRTVFFQNNSDRSIFISNSLVDPNISKLTPGSGVDLNKFFVTKLPKESSITFLLIARMLWDKGVGEFVSAAREIKCKYPGARFQLLGPLGVQNRTSIPSKQMEDWVAEGVVEYLGETDDVTSYIDKACCIVLPSYREGTSRVLLEGAAMGRPLIASNVPGCREVIDDGITGFLCEPRNHNDLLKKMESMIEETYETRTAMGIRGRSKVEKEFNQDIVCDLFIDAINHE